MVSDTSSHSFGWSGKEAEEDLQAFTAQVRKLSVRSFMVGCVGGRVGLVDGGWKRGAWRWEKENYFEIVG